MRQPDDQLFKVRHKISETVKNTRERNGMDEVKVVRGRIVKFMIEAGRPRSR